MNHIISKTLCVLLGLFSASALWGITSVWTDSDGGAFSDDLNWSEGVPGTGDFAQIDLGGDYTITLDADRTISGIILPNSGAAGEITLNLGGNTLTTTSTSAAGGTQALYVGGVGSDTRILRIENGTLETQVTRIGQSQSGEVVVENGGVLRFNSANSRIGDNGSTGRVKIGAGGTLEIAASQLDMGVGAEGSVGYLEVRGATARVNTTTVGPSNIMVGLATNSAEILITEGAKATLTEIRLGANGVESSGRLEVSDGAELTAGSIQVGYAGSGHALFTSGAEVNTVAINLYADGILEINGATVGLSSLNTRTWAGGSTYRLHLNGVGATPLSLHSVNLENTLDIHLGDGFIGNIGDIYTVIAYSGVLDGNFLDAEGNALLEGAQIAVGDYVFDLSYGGRQGGIVGLELVAIPEPGAFALGAAVLSLLMVVLIRKRKA